MMSKPQVYDPWPADAASISGRRQLQLLLCQDAAVWGTVKMHSRGLLSDQRAELYSTSYACLSIEIQG